MCSSSHQSNSRPIVFWCRLVNLLKIFLNDLLISQTYCVSTLRNNLRRCQIVPKLIKQPSTWRRARRSPLAIKDSLKPWGVISRKLGKNAANRWCDAFRAELWAVLMTNDKGEKLVKSQKVIRNWRLKMF